jgi:hypothetical protein
MLSVLPAKQAWGKKAGGHSKADENPDAKKDEKSAENELTERIIFDTMIKHLLNRTNTGTRGVKPEETGRNKIRKKLKNGLTKSR